MLFALDTSTNWASIALLDESRIIHSRAWEIGQQHSVQIFAAIADMLAASGVAIADISAIGVAQGPGSFNGVRVGVTLAKTLALVQQIPVVGISTLAAIGRIAAEQLPPKTRILTVLEAGRDELYAIWYDQEWYDTTIAEHAAVMIGRVEDIAKTAPPEQLIVVCGEIAPLHYDRFQAIFGDRIQLLAPDAVRERARGVALLAAQAFALQAPNAYLTLEPHYIRHPNITMSKRHPPPMLESEGNSL